MKTLTAVTPVGEFTRKTDSVYTYVNVWASPRAKAAFDSAAERTYRPCGVDARWIKDRGYGVTWHYTEAAARAAASSKRGYQWDHATLVGTFAVGA
jgi:hypothetical protein